MKKPTILLMHGYIGFGKTTVAKQFEALGFKRFTHDEYMSKLFGDVQSNENFVENYDAVTNLILDLAKNQVVNKQNDIILDFGFWTKQSRKDIVDIINSWNTNSSVIFVNIRCDLNVARNRCKDRDSKRKNGDLWVPVEVFDAKVHTFQPMDDSDEPYVRLNVN